MIDRIRPRIWLTQYDHRDRQARTKPISYRTLAALIHETARSPDDTLQQVHEGHVTVVPVGHHGMAVLDPDSKDNHYAEA